MLISLFRKMENVMDYNAIHAKIAKGAFLQKGGSGKEWVCFGRTMPKANKVKSKLATWWVKAENGSTVI